MIRSDQKENLELDNVKAALIKHYGNYGYGSLPGWAFDDGIKKEAQGLREKCAEGRGCQESG